MSTFSLYPPEIPSLWASAWGQDQHGYWQAIELKGVQQVLRWIPPGKFLMGSPEIDPERLNNETLHKVTISKGFWLADTACSQRLWVAVMGDNPSNFKESKDNPVETVSWDDCQQFIDTANQLLPAEFNLRFPTEAEWEYACRAKTQTVFSWGDSLTTEQANYDGNYPYNKGESGEYREKTIDVISFPANPWGLFQMHGNVREWCSDWYGEYLNQDVTDPIGSQHGQDRVLRGGSWANYGRSLRSASRSHYWLDFRFGSAGFRLAGG